MTDNERQEKMKHLKRQIQYRIDDKELTPCAFLISKTIDEKYVKEITDMFDKYNIKYESVDTAPAAFNLNRDWIQTDYKTSPIPCAIEYSGAYPSNWNMEDVVRLVELENEGKVIILVYNINGDKLEPNS